MKTSKISAALVGMSLGLFAFGAFAQSSSGQSALGTSGAASHDWSSPSQSKNYQHRANARHLGIGLSTSAFIVAGRWEVANGGIVAADVVWRKALNRQNRLEVGGLARFGFTPDAILVGGGIPLRFVLGMHDRLEMDFGIELSYTRIYFNQPIFVPRNGFISSFRWDVGYFVDPRVMLGITPIGFSAVAGERVQAFVTYEPGIWVRFSPI